MDGVGRLEGQPVSISRCAYCQRSRVFAEMLWCIMCQVSFCRGDCHALSVVEKRSWGAR